MIRRNLEVQMHHDRSLGIEVGQADWRWPRPTELGFGLFGGSLVRAFRSLSFVPPSHGTFWGGLGSSFGQGRLPPGSPRCCSLVLVYLSQALPVRAAQPGRLAAGVRKPRKAQSHDEPRAKRVSQGELVRPDGWCLANWLN